MIKFSKSLRSCQVSVYLESEPRCQISRVGAAISNPFVFISELVHFPSKDTEFSQVSQAKTKKENGISSP